MLKRTTITLNEVVYDGLYRHVGQQYINQFIEDSLQPHFFDSALDDGYQAMAADKEREAEAIACSIGMDLKELNRKLNAVRK